MPVATVKGWELWCYSPGHGRGQVTSRLPVSSTYRRLALPHRDRNEAAEDDSGKNTNLAHLATSLCDQFHRPHKPIDRQGEEKGDQVPLHQNPYNQSSSDQFSPTRHWLYARMALDCAPSDVLGIRTSLAGCGIRLQFVLLSTPPVTGRALSS